MNFKYLYLGVQAFHLLKMIGSSINESQAFFSFQIISPSYKFKWGLIMIIHSKLQHLSISFALVVFQSLNILQF